MSVDEQWKKVKEQMAARDRLVAQLDRSLALQKFWPEAFEHGSCQSGVVGSPGKYVFRITRGDGSVREFALKDVPDILIPHREMFETFHETMMRKRKERLAGKK